MCKLFKINGQKEFKEPLMFSKSYKNFVKELAQGISCQSCLASFSGSGIFCFFPGSYNGNNLSVKLLKSPCQDILLCKS